MTAPIKERPAVATCEWCDTEFRPLSFVHRYCSAPCSTAANNAKLKCDCGPCPTCGNMFRSRTPKRYCSMDCYVKSDQFVAMRAENLKSVCPTIGTPRKCKGCDCEYPRSRKAKFCTNRCRRSYYTARFDRWIANPEAVALPQNFDEFLSRSVLSCPVDGCQWEGANLGNHVNTQHGITAREFKKLCGFNLKTGLVGTELSEAMSERNRRMIAEGILSVDASHLTDHQGWKKGGYISLEAKEHAKKTRAEKPMLKDVFSPCRTCGTDVQQPSYGRRLYCSIPCREKHYKDRRVADLRCSHCGATFDGTDAQSLRSGRGLPVCCSIECRNGMNAAARVAAHQPTA